MLVTKALRFFLDLLFPIFCQGCAKEGVYFCSSCQLSINPPAACCFVCNKGSFLGIVHPECQSSKIALQGLLVAADYQTRSIQNLIWLLKYNSVSLISEVLAIIMVDYIIKQDLLEYFRQSLVVPVPLYPKKQRLRGFNQAELVAQEFARRLNLQYLPILKKIKNTKNQVDLEREERLKNLGDAFSVISISSLKERKILLVDDVATTGTTLNECAKVLKKQGAGEIWGLVAARN